METINAVQDSRSGVDKMTIHRQLGDKSRTLVRQRDREGREDRSESLNGIAPGLFRVLHVRASI